MTNFEAYEKLLNSHPEGETTYETVILSHSLFSKTYYFVIDTVPLTANLDASQGGALVTFEPASIKSTNAQNSDDLDQIANFTIADVNNILDSELDRIPLGTEEVPLLGYGIYHSDYLDEPVEFTEYEINSVPQQKGVFTVRAGVPDLNSDQTGEIFDFDRFPMLRSIS